MLTFENSESQAKRWTVAVDFDGVIHSYTSGWQGAAVISDPPVEGAIAWLESMTRDFDVVILSTRGDQEGANDAINAWLAVYGYRGPELLVTSKKVPALIYIDDRAWRFKGIFPTKGEIHRARPWNHDRREVV